MRTPSRAELRKRGKKFLTIPIIPDPESLTWDPLDGELKKKLDEQPYVSLSRDRKLALEGNQEEGKAAAEDAGKSDDAMEVDVNEEELSLFEIRMPGVMTAEEVETKLDLDHWLLLVQGTLIHTSVS